MDDVELAVTHETARLRPNGMSVELAIDLFPIVMAIVLFLAVYMSVTD